MRALQAKFHKVIHLELEHILVLTHLCVFNFTVLFHHDKSSDFLSCLMLKKGYSFQSTPTNTGQHRRQMPIDYMYVVSFPTESSLMAFPGQRGDGII